LLVLLDTSIYLFALKSEEGAAFFEQRFLPLIFRTYLSSVVVEELYAGALDRVAIQLIENQVGALERVGRVVPPPHKDWKDAGKRVAQITRKAPHRMSKVQQMLNDILISADPLQSGARAHPQRG
jgi:predicted nucleic acid-binding protein